MAELRSAIFWVLCPKQSLHCYIHIYNVLNATQLKNVINITFCPTKCKTNSIVRNGS
ncbi:MAG: hypothetical protein IM570_19220 [Pseudanabaena sp. M179S2SP2A07QC]|nr:hypothetical protein [Pseudanabaena sp. M179S2SP2A07QC]